MIKVDKIDGDFDKVEWVINYAAEVENAGWLTKQFNELGVKNMDQMSLTIPSDLTMNFNNGGKITVMATAF